MSFASFVRKANTLPVIYIEADHLERHVRPLVDHEYFYSARVRFRTCSPLPDDLNHQYTLGLRRQQEIKAHSKYHVWEAFTKFIAETHNEELYHTRMRG